MYFPSYFNFSKTHLNLKWFFKIWREFPTKYTPNNKKLFKIQKYGKKATFSKKKAENPKNEKTQIFNKFDIKFKR